MKFLPNTLKHLLSILATGYEENRTFLGNGLVICYVTHTLRRIHDPKITCYFTLKSLIKASHWRVKHGEKMKSQR